jgi:enoyl-CoA hydratase/carnithine racemase
VVGWRRVGDACTPGHLAVAASIAGTMDDLKARAMELAAELARQPATAVAGVLRAVEAAVSQSLDEALDCEREANRACSNSPDQRAGMTAFIEKRRPNFA